MRPARVLSALTCVSTIYKDLVKEYKEQPSVKVAFKKMITYVNHEFTVDY